MPTIQFDPLSYAQLPLFDAPGGIALATSLKSAMPDEMPAYVKSAAKEMGAALMELRAAYAGEPIPTVSDRRPADQAIDKAWAALHSRLSAAVALPEAHYPQAARAVELVRVVFPDGLSFLKLPFNQEWGESDRKLLRIETDGLEASINEIAGPEYLEQIRRAHAVYGEVLGITKASPLVQTPVRAEKLRKLRVEMSSYARKVLAQFEDDDERSIALVRKALQPIDEFRANASSRRTPVSDDAEVIDESPVAAPAPITPVAPIALAPVNGPIAPAPPAIAVPAPNGTPS